MVTDATDHRQKITHAPDGVFALAHRGRPALFFLEIDRATEVLSEPEKGFLKMIRFYLTYLRDGGYQRYLADFGVGERFKGFRALIVTTSEPRLQNMRETAGRLSFEPPRAKGFVWLATVDIFGDPGVISRAWNSCDPGDERDNYMLSPQSSR